MEQKSIEEKIIEQYHKLTPTQQEIIRDLIADLLLRQEQKPYVQD